MELHLPHCDGYLTFDAGFFIFDIFDFPNRFHEPVTDFTGFASIKIH
jgi:hypothetical protein